MISVHRHPAQQSFHPTVGVGSAPVAHNHTPASHGVGGNNFSVGAILTQMMETLNNMMDIGQGQTPGTGSQHSHTGGGSVNTKQGVRFGKNGGSVNTVQATSGSGKGGGSRGIVNVRHGNIGSGK